MSHDDLVSERREFLKHLVGAATAVTMAGMAADAARPGARPAPPTEPPDGGASPSFFTDVEWRFIVAAVDRLIPANEDGPGAVELQVPRFIDRQMDTEYGHGGLWYLQGPFEPDADFTLGYQQRYTPREFYRTAIAGIDQWCQAQHIKPFAELDRSLQDTLLASMEKGQIEVPGIKTGEFFLLLLTNTKEGYFADPMYGGNLRMGSWRMIGFPGARADFKDWVLQYGTTYPLGPVSILGEKA